MDLLGEIQKLPKLDIYNPDRPFPCDVKAAAKTDV